MTDELELRRLNKLSKKLDDETRAKYGVAFSEICKLPINSPRPVGRLWQCGCGSQHFWLIEGGAIQCSGCDEVTPIRWT